MHGPDLAFKVDAGGRLTCYHADAMANIIALTDANATNIVQYAYTPYGRSLPGTNAQPSTLNSQPYTFVGSQGVMEELPGLYFMRARYYSAEAGVFLSTDPVKNIGPGWKPVAYAYAGGTPLSSTDPTGLFRWWGYYGGPGWTGNRSVTYQTTFDWWKADQAGFLPEPCDDEDRLYYNHDYAYAEGRTFRDTEIFKNADRDLAGGLQALLLRYKAALAMEVNPLARLLLQAKIDHLSLAFGVFNLRQLGDYQSELPPVPPHETRGTDNSYGSGNSKQQFTQGALSAKSTAETLNLMQETPRAPATVATVISSSNNGGGGGGGSSGGSNSNAGSGNAFSRAVDSAIQKAQQSNNPVTRMIGNIANLGRSIGNAISRIFSRGKKK